MIVTFECDGFKNLQNVVLPLRPFQAFVGPNNAGKSNLFDALGLLSMLSDHDLSIIAQAVRGDPFEIFTRLPNGSYVTTMRLAVELLLDNTFTDEFAGDITLAQTRFRYEVEIARDDDRADNRIGITAEKLMSLSQGDKLPWQSSAAFRKAYLRSQGRRSYISADRDGTIVVHQDGATHGRTFPARKGRQHSALYVLRDAKAFPHVCAIRNELQRWRFSHLRPDAMRKPNAVGGPDRMDSAGRYLTASLYRMLQADPSMNVELSAWMRRLIPGARRVMVHQFRELRRYVLELEMDDGRRFSSEVLSDGILRVLGLFALRCDADRTSVALLEEPEKGIHPRRLDAVIALLKGMATNPSADDVDPADPLHQVLITTHSPNLVDALDLDDLILVEQYIHVGGNGAPPTQQTRYRPAVSSGPTADGQTTGKLRAEIRGLLEERDLGELWTSGSLGGVS